VRRIKGLKAFTLVELLVVIAIIALLISILLPSLSRARELSKRLVCASNVKGIGTSAKIYSNDNQEKWMVPGFRSTLIDAANVAYTESSGVVVGHLRAQESKKDNPGQANSGSTALSVTRAYWMLVRSGDVTVKQYTCPSSGDDDDPTENIDNYYDFTTYGNISYGYQVPFGPRDTQAREGMDNRQSVAADKGPWYFATAIPDWNDGGNPPPVDLDDSPKEWRLFNSQNHGGQANGEGQNILFADGHANFNRIPAVGVDSDNVYTLMLNSWNALPYNRIHGDAPQEAPEDPYPGQEAFGTGANKYASTDSLVFP